MMVIHLPLTYAAHFDEKSSAGNQPAPGEPYCTIADGRSCLSPPPQAVPDDGCRPGGVTPAGARPDAIAASTADLPGADRARNTIETAEQQADRAPPATHGKVAVPLLGVCPITGCNLMLPS
jgi:hypothetical protein